MKDHNLLLSEMQASKGLVDYLQDRIDQPQVSYGDMQRMLRKIGELKLHMKSLEAQLDTQK